MRPFPVILATLVVSTGLTAAQAWAADPLVTLTVPVELKSVNAKWIGGAVVCQANVKNPDTGKDELYPKTASAGFKFDANGDSAGVHTISIPRVPGDPRPPTSAYCAIYLYEAGSGSPGFPQPSSYNYGVDPDTVRAAVNTPYKASAEVKF